jgi:RimJ/RimL family protein N-acetyltransferase
MKDKEISDNMLSFPFPYTELDAKSFLFKNAYQKNYWAIRDKEKLIGFIGVYPLLAPALKHGASLFYWISKDYRGKKITLAAAAKVSEIAFSTLKLERMEASCIETNIASQKILEKSGFILEGIKKKAFKKNDEMLDLIYFAKVKS